MADQATILPPTLNAFETPIGPQPVSEKLYSPQQRTIVLREKVFGFSDDFYVKTPEDIDICKCKGKLFSMRGKKMFSDLEGNELFTLSKKMMALQSSFRGESPNGYDFEVKGHFKLMGSKSTITFKNAADNMNVEMELTGDWIDRSAKIKIGDRIVAVISRSYFNKRELLGNSQTYFVTIAPNVDLSLIAGICVALDERENE